VDPVEVIPLQAGDLPWVAALAGRRAEQRERFAPRFWRRAPDAARVHARHLGALIDDPAVPAMRTAHMFAFGLPRPGDLLIDDAAAESAEDWTAEGPALLRHLAGDSPVRVVCPAPEPHRAALAARLGLALVETWWHRDLARSPAAGPAEGAVQVRGARGRLVAAPPVYAPGGPVLLVTAYDDERALARIEEEAAARGATVGVVSRPPGAAVAGYRLTCDFYEGVVA
jgi:hypothetical protein